MACFDDSDQGQYDFTYRIPASVKAAHDHLHLVSYKLKGLVDVRKGTQSGKTVVELTGAILESSKKKSLVDTKGSQLAVTPVVNIRVKLPR